MTTLKAQEFEIEELPKELRGLNLSFIHELAKFVGNYGESGGTVGMKGFRLVFGEGEKLIDVISIVRPGYFILALSLKNDVPSEDGVHTLKIYFDSSSGQEIGLVKWDSSISLDNVNNALAQFKSKLN